MNPRPRKSTARRLRAFPVRWFSTAPLETGKRKQLSPIDFGFRLQAEASDLLLQDDALGPRAGPSAQGGYLMIKQRKQTADWQFWFSDRFTGARNPARLPTLDAIPSNPLRPLSSPFYQDRETPACAA